MTEEQRAKSRAYYAANIERCRANARRYVAAHKKVCYERHKAWVESHKEHLAEYARNRRRKNPERARAIQKAAYYRDHDATLSKKKAYRDSHLEQTREMNRRAEVRRKKRKCTDAEYYAKRRGQARLSRCMARFRKGEIYYPEPRRRILDFCVMGERFCDSRSQFLAENLTDSQRAFARDLAIQRRGER